MLLPDVNVLVYAHRAESPEHEAHARWLTELVNGQEPFGMSEQVLSSFVRIVTNPRIFKTPTPLETALTFCRSLLSRPNVVRLRPGARHFDLFADLCHRTNAPSKLVADAYLAAIAMEHGCEWVTTDSDFARFPGLRWRHPLRPATH
ncbi:MAG: type II toxin-antitoxin system VapC family toxin [Myxococcales bacterium]